MAGFALALLGGAMEGWGKGQLEAIKATREEKLRQLELDRTERLALRQMEFQKSENALSRTSEEKRAASALTVQERIAAAQEAGATTRTNIGETGANTRTFAQLQAAKDNLDKTLGADVVKTDKMIQAEADRLATSEAGATHRTELGIEADKERTGATIQGQKDVEQMRIDAQERANIKQVPVVENGETVIRLEQNGKLLPRAVDPTTGKPVEYAISPDDTPEAKNHKYLLSIGTDPKEAKTLAYPTKDTDPLIRWDALYKITLDSMTSDLTTATAEDRQAAIDETTALAGPRPGGGEPSTAAPAAATAQTKPLPAGETTESMVAAAKAAVAGGKNKAEVRRILQEYGIDPATAGF
jgi:hypothetical protein